LLFFPIKSPPLSEKEFREPDSDPSPSSDLTGLSLISIFSFSSKILCYLLIFGYSLFSNAAFAILYNADKSILLSLLLLLLLTLALILEPILLIRLIFPTPFMSPSLAETSLFVILRRASIV
jgi:hypothetical protein